MPISKAILQLKLYLSNIWRNFTADWSILLEQPTAQIELNDAFERASIPSFGFYFTEPSRRVGGGKRNVSGRYSSQKMGVTIQFESHKVELPFIYQLEHDDDVLEYYDQPPSFILSYQSSSGKNL